MHITTLNVNEVNNAIIEKITKQKNDKRINAVIEAKQKIKMWKASITDMELKLREAEKENWKPLIGSYEDELELDS